jgi:hypothetical protein
VGRSVPSVPLTGGTTVVVGGRIPLVTSLAPVVGLGVSLGTTTDVGGRPVVVVSASVVDGGRTALVTSSTILETPLPKPSDRGGGVLVVGVVVGADGVVVASSDGTTWEVGGRIALVMSSMRPPSSAVDVGVTTPVGATTIGDEGGVFVADEAADEPTDESTAVSVGSSATRSVLGEVAGVVGVVAGVVGDVPGVVGSRVVSVVTSSVSDDNPPVRLEIISVRERPSSVVCLVVKVVNSLGVDCEAELVIVWLVNCRLMCLG